MLAGIAPWDLTLQRLTPRALREIRIHRHEHESSITPYGDLGSSDPKWAEGWPVVLTTGVGPVREILLIILDDTDQQHPCNDQDIQPVNHDEANRMRRFRHLHRSFISSL